MTFSLALDDGDLVQQGGRLALVVGADKLKQDITLWTTERYAIDRFHPAMGSRLQDYIGDVIDYSTHTRIYGEVLRVLNNYQKVQYLGLRQNPQRYSLSELLWSINDVKVAVEFDAARISANVSNGEQLPINATVSAHLQGGF